MKQLFLLLLFFCSCFVYGQDLIVTVSGDSLKCKITEVNSEEIQFRFGQGRVISINRSEVASFQYNFEPVSGKEKGDKKSGTGKSKPSSVNNNQKQARSYLPFSVGVSGGIRSFGSVSTGEMKSAVPIVFGLDAAGFFKQSIGAGIKLNIANSIVDFEDTGSWYDQILFVGPGLYGRWTKSKLELTASASVGALMWKMADINLEKVTETSQSATSFGGYLSTGVNYLLSNNISIGLNFQTAVGKVKMEDSFERNPAGAGVTIGVNIKF